MDKRKDIVSLLHIHMLVWAIIGFIFGILPWPEPKLHAAMPLIMLAVGMVSSPLFILMYKKSHNSEIAGKTAAAVSNIPGFVAMSACGLAVWISFLNSGKDVGIILILVILASVITFIKYKFVRSILDDYPM